MDRKTEGFRRILGATIKLGAAVDAERLAYDDNQLLQTEQSRIDYQAARQNTNWCRETLTDAERGRS